MTTVLQIFRVVDVTENGMPDGEYPGIWSGYMIEVAIEGVIYDLKVREGMRGMVPCIVKVSDGVIDIQTDNKIK